MSAAWWEKVLFQAFLAFWTAYFLAKRAAQEADREVPNEKADDRARRFWAAVRRLREAGRDPRPDNPAPPVP